MQPNKPSQADLFNREPEIDPDTSLAVEAIEKAWPKPWKIMRAKKGGGGYEIVVAKPGPDGQSFEVKELQLDGQYAVTHEKDRDDVPAVNEGKSEAQRKGEAQAARDPHGNPAARHTDWQSDREAKQQQESKQPDARQQDTRQQDARHHDTSRKHEGR